MIGNLTLNSRTSGSVVRGAPLSWRVRNFLRPAHLHGLFAILIAWLASKLTHLPYLVGEWRVEVRRADGTIEDYGVVCRKLITDAGLVKFADAFHDASFDLSTFKYGGVGSGSTAPAVGDTALGSEYTTQLAVDNTRATATSSKPTTTSVLKQFTQTFDASVSVAEFGVFSQAATGGGTLLDRGTMTALVLGSGDGFTGKLTVTFARGS